MIKITVPENELMMEFYDRVQLIPVPKVTLTMEHSLISLHKWEAKWKVPFFHTEKTTEQMLDYLKIMTLTKNVNEYTYYAIPEKEMTRIVDYIKDKQTAATFSNNLIGAQKHSDELVTAETIYWWMIALGIPVEFQKWHLEQLLALIKFVSIKSDPNPKKMTEKERILRNAEINARNKARFGVK